MRSFEFLTNHGLALLCIVGDPGVRMRDIAANAEITERAAQRIVADLVEAGYLDRERVGRRNRYTLRPSLPVSLPALRDAHLTVLLDALSPMISSDSLAQAIPTAVAD